MTQDKIILMIDHYKSSKNKDESVINTFNIQNAFVNSHLKAFLIFRHARDNHGLRAKLGSSSLSQLD